MTRKMSLLENAAGMSRETAAKAVLCDRVSFHSSGIDCRRGLYRGATSTGIHYHDDTNLVLTLSGSLAQNMCSRSTIVTPSTLMYVPAGELHSTDFGPRGAVCFFVAIDQAWTEKRLDGTKINPDEPRVALAGSFLQTLAFKMYQEFKSPDALSSLIVESALLELLARWFREQRTQSHDVPGWLRSVKTLLHDSFREALSLRDLSQAVGVHPSHIAREFRRTYGLTAGEFIRKLRVDFVADRLRRLSNHEPTTSLTQLALEAGFSSHAHMSTAFKRLTGLTPSQFKISDRITSIR
jgi:AraC family transcriptional regulator